MSKETNIRLIVMANKENREKFIYAIEQQFGFSKLTQQTMMAITQTHFGLNEDNQTYQIQLIVMAPNHSTFQQLVKRQIEATEHVIILDAPTQTLPNINKYSKSDNETDIDVFHRAFNAAVGKENQIAAGKQTHNIEQLEQEPPADSKPNTGRSSTMATLARRLNAKIKELQQTSKVSKEKTQPQLEEKKEGLKAEHADGQETQSTVKPQHYTHFLDTATHGPGAGL